MTLTTRPNLKLASGLTALIFLLCYLITLSPKFKLNPDFISNAIVLDLLITAPAVYYFVIRKSSISKFTVARVFIAGVLFAGLILNSQSNTLLAIVKTWVAPVVELIVISFIAWKFYAAARDAKLSGRENFDFMIYCRQLLTKVTGNEKAANILSSEVGVFYYAFISKKKKDFDNISSFTSYRENGIIPVLSIFLSIFIIETTGVHFLINMWSTTAAWIITGLSLYTCLQLFAHIRAIKARPILLGSETLEISNGLAGDAVIRYDNILKVDYTNEIPNDVNTLKLSLLRKLEKHNCVLYLKQPVEVNLIFGIKKKTQTILFFTDNKKEFAAALNQKIVGNRSVE